VPGCRAAAARPARRAPCGSRSPASSARPSKRLAPSGPGWRVLPRQ
jgi:hypothetical protein